MPKTTILKTDGTVVVREWKEDEYPDLSWLQEAVGGYVTLVVLDDGKHLYCDEDGELRRLPENRTAHDRLGPTANTPRGFLLGNVVLCEGFPQIGPKDEPADSEDDLVVYELE